MYIYIYISHIYKYIYIYILSFRSQTASPNTVSEGVWSPRVYIYII